MKSGYSISRLTGAFILLALLFFACRGAVAALPPEQQSRVLILNSYHPLYSWSDNELQGIIQTMRKRNQAFEPLIEYLDCKLYPSMSHFSYLRDLYRFKYGNTRIPLVIAADNPALQFALIYRRDLFPNAPIVFCGINGFMPEMFQGQQNVTGVAEVLDSRGTVEVMLKLHPDASEIFVIHDFTPTGLATRREAQAQLALLENRVRIHFMTDISTNQMLAEIGKLPKSALVLSLSYSRDSEGRVFDHSQISKLLSEKSPVPVYGVHEERLSYGIVGGSMLSGRLHGVRAAEIAMEVLNGRYASDIPVDMHSTARLMFDYRQLKRFNIDLDRLPPGSIVVNKPESFYGRYTLLVWGMITLLGALVTIIGFLAYIASERERSARGLEEKASELEDRVTARTRELSESNQGLMEEVRQRAAAQEEISRLNDDLLCRTKALESTNREMEAFSYSVSHDLRAPLRHIEGFSRLLMEECADRIEEHGRDYLNRVCRASNRMSMLIDDLLNLSKVSRGDILCRQVNLTQMAQEICGELQESNPGRQVTFRIAEDMIAWGDPRLLRAMLVNLFGNAWKYTGKKDQATIEFGCLLMEEGKAWFLKDNGVGFDMNYADRLFGTFQRLHHANDFEGTGIGLATVQRIINRHQGKVWAESEIGVGATFYFTLPEQNSRELS